MGVTAVRESPSPATTTSVAWLPVNPPKKTSVVPVVPRFVPVIVTVWPPAVGPLSGLIPLNAMVGGGM